jgi:uncharacterized repeat protein (TIGR04138 family)
MAKPSTEQRKTFEDIVREVGTYAPDAYQFVREGLTRASEAIHGRISKREQRVMQWMTESGLTIEAVQQLYDEKQLPANIRADIDKLGGIDAINRHVTGQELCLALRDLAVEKFGLLAGVVLGHWGLHSTHDFGRIVFALVDNGLLSKQPTDTIRDFDRVFDFRETFDRSYQIVVDKQNGCRQG